MAYCSNCGQQLADGAKFCSACGQKVEMIYSKQHEERKTVYDGEIHKCPVCGNPIGAYDLTCSLCGYEKRGPHSSSSLRYFIEALSQAENNEERATLISEYPVPNNREDILEFIILASANVSGKSNRLVFYAWVSKFEQCHEKAKLLPLSEEDRNRIKRIHRRTSLRILGGKIFHACATVIDGIKSIFLSIKNPILRIVAIVLCLSWLPAVKTGFALAGLFALPVLLIFLFNKLKK